MSTSNDAYKDEWLQFLEFIKRKYGNNSSDYIRNIDYNNRSTKSVAQYYKAKYSIADITSTTKLDQLLNKFMIFLQNYFNYINTYS